MLLQDGFSAPTFTGNDDMVASTKWKHLYGAERKQKKGCLRAHKVERSISAARMASG